MSDQDPRVVLGMTALLVGVAMLLKEEENQPTRGQHWIGKDGAKPTKWVYVLGILRKYQKLLIFT